MKERCFRHAPHISVILREKPRFFFKPKKGESEWILKGGIWSVDSSLSPVSVVLHPQCRPVSRWWEGGREGAGEGTGVPRWGGHCGEI